ncbi:MAG: hypothetical protein QXP02_03265 [Desulfurococcaceae archaeon]
MNLDNGRTNGNDFLCKLIAELLSNIDIYFSNNVLNSEGWKIFNLLSHAILENKPYYRRRIYRARRDPRYEVIEKLLKDMFIDNC